MRTNKSLHLVCSALGTLLLGCHAQFRDGNICLILFSMFDYYILEACSFLIEDRKGNGSGDQRMWGGTGGVEGRKTTVRIYYMRKYISAKWNS